MSARIVKQRRTSQVARRARTLILMCTVVALVFAFRLVGIQVIDAPATNAQAAGQRGVEQTIPGQRGKIVTEKNNDAPGELVTLAESAQRFTVAIDPAIITAVPMKQEDGTSRQVDFPEAAKLIAQATGQTQQQLLDIVNQAIAANPQSRYALVKSGIDVETLDRVKALGLPYLSYTQQSSRTYPNGQVAGNIVGFVGSEGEALAGLEYAQDACLAGHDGTLTYERAAPNAGNVPLPQSERIVEPAVNGGQLELTVNADLSWFASQTIAEQVKLMGAQWGSVLVSDVKTGQIVAAAEYPAVDPNKPSLAAAEDRGSRIFTATYEPGSTIKTMSAAMAIDQGVADPLTRVVAPGTIRLGDASFGDNNPGHAPLYLTLAGVITASSNTGIAQIAGKVDKGTRAEYLKRFGFGERTDVGFPGEEAGLVRPADEWEDQTSYATLFGQGFTGTQAQLVQAYQSLGNGGVRLPMRLVESCTAPDGTVTEPALHDPVRVVSPEAAKAARDLIETTAQKSYNAKDFAIPGYRIGVKTATAQVANGSGGYSSDFMVGVTGMAPMNDPRFVVSVQLFKPVTMVGSDAAVAPWQRIMAQALKMYHIEPTTDGAPDIPTKYDP